MALPRTIATESIFGRQNNCKPILTSDGEVFVATSWGSFPNGEVSVYWSDDPTNEAFQLLQTFSTSQVNTAAWVLDPETQTIHLAYTDDTTVYYVRINAGTKTVTNVTSFSATYTVEGLWFFYRSQTTDSLVLMTSDQGTNATTGEAERTLNFYTKAPGSNSFTTSGNITNFGQLYDPVITPSGSIHVIYWRFIAGPGFPAIYDAKVTTLKTNNGQTTRRTFVSSKNLIEELSTVYGAGVAYSIGVTGSTRVVSNFRFGGLEAPPYVNASVTILEDEETGLVDSSTGNYLEIERASVGTDDVPFAGMLAADSVSEHLIYRRDPNTGNDQLRYKRRGHTQSGYSSGHTLVSNVSAIFPNSMAVFTRGGNEVFGFVYYIDAVWYYDERDVDFAFDQVPEPSSIGSDEAFGDMAICAGICPVGIESAETIPIMGDGSGIAEDNVIDLAGLGIPSEEAFDPTFRFPLFYRAGDPIGPFSVPPEETFGDMTIQFPTIFPPSIESGEVFGLNHGVGAFDPNGITLIWKLHDRVVGAELRYEIKKF